MQRKKPVVPDPSTESEQDLVAQLPVDIKHWMESSGINDLEYTVYIYRCDRRTGPGQRARKFVNQYDNQVPEFTELGELYGGGFYELYVRYYDSEDNAHSKKLTINIDESWDEIRDAKKREKELQNPQRQPAPVDNGNNSFMQGILMVRALTESVAPILQPLLSGKQAGANNHDGFAETMKMFSAMGTEMLQNNFKNQLELQSQMMNTVNSMGIEPEEKDNGYVEEIINLLGRFLPVLQGMSEQGSRKAAQTYLNTDDKLKAILSDPERATEAYNKLVAKHGKETADRTFRAFGMIKAEPLQRRRKQPVTPQEVPPATRTARKPRKSAKVAAVQ